MYSEELEMEVRQLREENAGLRRFWAEFPKCVPTPRGCWVWFDEYEVANLRAALEAVGNYGGDPGIHPGPLAVLNSGDWVGQIYHKLPKMSGVAPNKTPLQYRLEAETGKGERGR